MLARTLGIFISYYAFECCNGSEANKLTNREIMFAVWAAYIRGAIAFGLTMNLNDKFFGDENATPEVRANSAEVVQTTLLALVIITTFFFGGFTPMVKSCLMGKETTLEDMNMTIAQKRRQTLVDRNSMMDDPMKMDLTSRGSGNPRVGSFLQYVTDK